MADQERQMILAAQRGQTDGYRYLMGRYGRQVQLLVMQMVGDSRDAEELTYLAEEALQVAYKLQEPLEELRAFYASFDEEEPDTATHIIAI